MLPRELFVKIGGFSRGALAVLRRTCEDLRHIRGGTWKISARVNASGAPAALVLDGGIIYSPPCRGGIYLIVDGVITPCRTQWVQYITTLVRELYLVGRDTNVVYSIYNIYTDYNIGLMRQNDKIKVIQRGVVLVRDESDIGLLGEYAPKYGGVSGDGVSGDGVSGDNGAQFRSAFITVAVHAHVDVAAVKLSVNFCNTVETCPNALHLHQRV